MNKSFFSLLSGSIFLLSAFAFQLTHAQGTGASLTTAEAAWPNKPVKLVAVFPPGGSVDQVARVLAAQLSVQLGQQFVVENKGGGSGSIGTTSVAQASGDGYTLGVVFDTHAVNPSLIPNMAFNTQRDLANIFLVGTSPMVVVAHPSSGFKTFRDVIAASRNKPGSVAYGTIGTGSLGHLALTQIANNVGIELTHVPYRGGGPLVTDALAGQVPLSIGTVFLMSPHIKTAKLQPLGLTSKSTDPQLPGVVPIADQSIAGLASFEALAWWGVIGPSSLSPALIKRINEEFAKALKVPAVAERLTAQGIDLLGSSSNQMDAFLKGEIDRWAKVVRDNKIKAGD